MSKSSNIVNNNDNNQYNNINNNQNTVNHIIPNWTHSEFFYSVKNNILDAKGIFETFFCLARLSKYHKK
jgi:hypothetical protein